MSGVRPRRPASFKEHAEARRYFRAAEAMVAALNKLCDEADKQDLRCFHVENAVCGFSPTVTVEQVRAILAGGDKQ